VVGYSPFSLCVIHKEGLCPISRDIKGLIDDDDDVYQQWGYQADDNECGTEDPEVHRRKPVEKSEARRREPAARVGNRAHMLALALGVHPKHDLRY
jgi:hypothetical protein